MVQATIRRFGAIRALVFVGLLGIGVIASTAVPAVGSSNPWTPTGSMTNARTHHAATLLANGEVLVAGGLCRGGFTYPDNSAELYDPSKGTWKATGSMNVARANTAAALLAKRPGAHRGRKQLAERRWPTTRSREKFYRDLAVQGASVRLGWKPVGKRAGLNDFPPSRGTRHSSGAAAHKHA
jgi:hypothetical protein